MSKGVIWLAERSIPGFKFALITYDPVNFEESIKDEVWVKVINDEIEAIEWNDTWELVDLHKYKDCIGV